MNRVNLLDDLVLDTFVVEPLLMLLLARRGHGTAGRDSDTILQHTLATCEFVRECNYVLAAQA